MRLWPDGSATIPTVTAEFGVPHPSTGWHRGIDLIGWDTIRAADAGYVIFAGWNGTAGYEVKIRHDDGYFTRYLHLDWFYGWSGQRMELADEIGLMGATGQVTGVHLHFEVIAPDGETRVNPRDYIGTPPPPPARKDTDTMRAIIQNGQPNSGIIIQDNAPPSSLTESVFVALCGAYGLTAQTMDAWQYDTAVREQWTAANNYKAFVTPTSTNTLAAVSVGASVLALVGVLALLFILL